MLIRKESGLELSCGVEKLAVPITEIVLLSASVIEISRVDIVPGSMLRR